MTTNAQALNQAMRVTRFDTRHLSIADSPENNREFVVVMDSYSHDCQEALDKISRMLGPLVQYMASEFQDALNECYEKMVTPMAEPMMAAPKLYALMNDEQRADVDESFSFTYPDSDQIVEITEALDSVPDNSPIYEPVQNLLSLLNDYSDVSWNINDGVLLTPADTARSRILDEISSAMTERRFVDPILVDQMRSLEDAEAALIIREASPDLWGLYHHLEERREFDQDERDDMADKGMAMPDGSYPIGNISDLRNAIQSYGRAKDKAAVKMWIMKRAKELEAESELPDDWMARSIAEPKAAEPKETKTMNIRQAMRASDPVVAALDSKGVKDDPMPILDSPAAVDQDAPESVPSEAPLQMDEVRAILARTDLTEDQRTGIVRHYLEGVERELLSASNPQGSGLTREDVIAAMRSVIAPYAQEIAEIRAMVEGGEVAPTRRSLLPVALGSEEERSYYAPQSIRSLARRGMNY